MSENVDVIVYLAKENFTTKVIASIYWTKGDPNPDRRVFCLSAMNGEEQITAYITKDQLITLAEQAGLTVQSNENKAIKTEDQ